MTSPNICYLNIVLDKIKAMSLALLFTDFFSCRKKDSKITAKPRIFRQKLVFVFIYLRSQCDKNISAETFTSLHWRQLGTFQTFWDLRLALVRGISFLNDSSLCNLFKRSCTGRRDHCPFHPLNWFCMTFTWSGIGIGIVILKKTTWNFMR